DDAAPRKPYAPRDDAAPRKPYAAKPDGERKTYVKREAPADGAPKPRWAKPEGAKPEGFKPKSAGFKSHGAADKPGRAAGFKSHGGEGKTFAKPRPVVDAKDTSKRFVPPKKK
ncbi:MAG: DEAD/DEAH box helicase, partial [Pseudorhodobacter sp.]|nr:DEAD/DEAH box helicase [Pseudorhodobacter sp.]